MEQAENLVLNASEELWNNQKVWKTGPIVVADYMSRAMFTDLEQSGHRKLEYKFDEAQPDIGKVLYVGEGTMLHSSTVMWFLFAVRDQFLRMGIDKRPRPGVPPRVLGSGGLVDFPGRSRNVDFAIFERLEKHPVRDALTPLVVEVSDTNKSEVAVLEFLEHVCDALGSNTRIGIGILFKSRSSADFNFDVFVKRTGKEVVTYSVGKSTEDMVLEIPLEDVLRSRDLLGQAPKGSKLTLDFCALRDELEWALDPHTPAQRKRLRRELL